MASGSPSRRRHSSPTADSVGSVGSQGAPADSARCRKSCTAGAICTSTSPLGTPSPPRTSSRSPSRPSGSRLVATTRNGSAPLSNRLTNSATPSRTCSQLSRTSEGGPAREAHRRGLGRGHAELAAHLLHTGAGGEGGELGGHDTTREPLGQGAGDLGDEPGLAAATRPGHGHQRRVRDQLDELDLLGIASQERRPRRHHTSLASEPAPARADQVGRVARATASASASRPGSTTVSPPAPSGWRNTSWTSTASTASCVGSAGTGVAPRRVRRSSRLRRADSTAACSARASASGFSEAPAAGPVGDGHLGCARLDPGRGEDTAVVGSAGAGPVLVDRAAALDQHRAVATLVEAEQHVPVGPAGSREEERGGDVRQRVGLVGLDVDELRRACSTLCSLRRALPTARRRGWRSAPNGARPRSPLRRGCRRPRRASAPCGSYAPG